MLLSHNIKTIARVTSLHGNFTCVWCSEHKTLIKRMFLILGMKIKEQRSIQMLRQPVKSPNPVKAETLKFSQEEQDNLGLPLPGHSWRHRVGNWLCSKGPTVLSEGCSVAIWLVKSSSLSKSLPTISAWGCLVIFHMWCSQKRNHTSYPCICPPQELPVYKQHFHSLSDASP